MRSFCRAGNLKALLSLEAGLPDVLEDIRGLVATHYGSDFHGALQNDLLALGSQKGPSATRVSSDRPFVELPTDTYDLLVGRLRLDDAPQQFSSHRTASSTDTSVNPRVQYHNQLEHKGVIYRAMACRSSTDATITFNSPGTSSVRAGIISKIFLHSRPSIDGTTIFEFFLVVKTYQELSAEEVSFDPYRRFPMLEAYLVKEEMFPTIIKASDIISHCATCPYNHLNLNNGPYRVILSLNRVCII